MNISGGDDSFEIDNCYCSLFRTFKRVKDLNAKFVISENLNPDSRENSFWVKPRISLKEFKSTTSQVNYQSNMMTPQCMNKNDWDQGNRSTLDDSFSIIDNLYTSRTLQKR